MGKQIAVGLIICAVTVAAPAQEYPNANVPWTGRSLPQKGRVIFKGTHSATILIQRSGPARRGPLGNRLGGETRQEIAGALTMDAQIDGNALTIRVTGTGGMNSGTYTGLIKGGYCQATGDRGGTFEGACGPNGFSGTIRSGAADRASYAGRFDTAVASVEDYAARSGPAVRAPGSRCFGTVAPGLVVVGRYALSAGRGRDQHGHKAGAGKDRASNATRRVHCPDHRGRRGRSVHRIWSQPEQDDRATNPQRLWRPHEGRILRQRHDVPCA